MDPGDAADLISGAVPRGMAVWADLGAGEGTFTRALARLLGRGSRIYAVDRDPRALATLQRWVPHDGVAVVPVTADFSRPFDLPTLDAAPLDGLLFANSLHFVRRPEMVVKGLVAQLRPGGRVVIVEYDRRGASRWVPFPIPATGVAALAAAAGLISPTITATRPSAFGGTLYVAAAERPRSRVD
jgi:SAM-dependent methyltransferase